MIKAVLLIVGLLPLLQSCSLSGSKNSEVSWPGEQWATSTPEAEGIDPTAIDAIHQDIIAGKYGLIDEFLLIRHGQVVADHSYQQNYDSIAAKYDTTNHQFNYDHPDWHPYYKRGRLHSLQSVTKSVTSIALGIAIDHGHLQGVDIHPMKMLHPYMSDTTDPVSHWDRKRMMTLEDLLTMRSGIDWNEMTSYESGDNSCIIMEGSNDWIRYVVNRPMREDPGTRWDYNSGASVLLGKLVGLSTGQRVDQWTNEKLFLPIGIKDYYWKITPTKEVDTEGGLYLSAHDLARIGYLFLHKGKWNDQQIVSEDWVSKSIQPTVKDIIPDNNKEDSGYGYQWWVPSTAPFIFAGRGYGGQFIMVAPAYDMVVVFNGWNIHDDKTSLSSLHALQDRIIPATKP